MSLLKRYFSYDRNDMGYNESVIIINRMIVYDTDSTIEGKTTYDFSMYPKTKIILLIRLNIFLIRLNIFLRYFIHP